MDSKEKILKILDLTEVHNNLLPSHGFYLFQIHSELMKFPSLWGLDLEERIGFANNANSSASLYFYVSCFCLPCFPKHFTYLSVQIFLTPNELFVKLRSFFYFLHFFFLFCIFVLVVCNCTDRPPLTKNRAQPKLLVAFVKANVA